MEEGDRDAEGQGLMMEPGVWHELIGKDIEIKVSLPSITSVDLAPSIRASS